MNVIDLILESTVLYFVFADQFPTLKQENDENGGCFSIRVIFSKLFPQ